MPYTFQEHRGRKDGFAHLVPRTGTKDSRKRPELARADLVQYGDGRFVLVLLKACIDEIAQVNGEILLPGLAGRVLGGRHDFLGALDVRVPSFEESGVDADEQGDSTERVG